MNAVEHYQQVVRLYQEARRPWPATAIEIADWGLRAGHLKPKPADLMKQFASELSRAMREEYITDPQGREVRAKHARRTTIGGEQKTLWDDIRTAPRDHMRAAFQQRREQIVGDCRQLKLDVDSYNANRNAEAPIQIVFDFRDDLAELALAGLA